MPDFRELITREAKILDSLPLREQFAHRPFWQDHTDLIRKNTAVRHHQTVEFMITFLEVDPWFWGSGYLKEKLIRRLKQAPLKDPQKARLRTVALDAVLRRPHREFPHYCRLARTLQTPDFVGRIERLAEASHDGSVRARARKMLHVMAS